MISKLRVYLWSIFYLLLAFDSYCQSIAPLGGYLKSNCINCDEFNQPPEYHVYAFAYFKQGEFVPDSINISFDEGGLFKPIEKSLMEDLCEGIVKVQYGPLKYTFY